MSAPVVPEKKADEALAEILHSIAAEEIALAHIINAEGEKIQKAINDYACNLDDLVDINKSVSKTMKSVIMKEILLMLKMEQVCEVAECLDVEVSTTTGKKKGGKRSAAD